MRRKWLRLADIVWLRARKNWFRMNKAETVIEQMLLDIQRLQKTLKVT